MESTDKCENGPKQIEFGKETLLRKIFLNIFISAFVILCYFYASEVFGSISSSFILEPSLTIQFGSTLLVFTFLSILVGKYHGFLAGFIGEFLFQIAYYHAIFYVWCFAIGVYGFFCGIYKYRPLKYSDPMKIYYTFVALIIISFLMIVIILILNIIFVQNDLSINKIISNYGFEFLVEALISVVFIVPLLLYLYDKVFSKKEKHWYYLLLTHHPVIASDHTFYLKFGRTYVYFCSRCSGMVIGAVLAIFATHLYEKVYNTPFSPELAVLMCVILPIPGLIDWGTQHLLLRKSTTKSRLLTGYILGNALHFLSYTQKYYFFMVFILILYFSIFGLLMYFGNKREIAQLDEEVEDTKNGQKEVKNWTPINK